MHGFVEFSDWERDIINHPVFQRLRRIRQLACSDHVFPGATHTRFEHSLGVMHVATRLFNKIVGKCRPMLEDRLGYDPVASRAYFLVRLSALLHDVGHAPFSHTGEDLMRNAKDGHRFKHEDYTAELVRNEMRDVIDDHAFNRSNLHITGEEIANFYLGKPVIGPDLLFWKDLVSGQLDGDRMDYLLRDSYHCGVEYGKFDLGRILDTITVVDDQREEAPNGLRVAIEDGGLHAAEGLILARYFMFTQVYFHPARKAFDYHAAECLRATLEQDKKSHGKLPRPDSADGRKQFLKLDDWAVLGAACDGVGGRHAKAILLHEHDRCVWKTPEVPRPEHIRNFEVAKRKLTEVIPDCWSVNAASEWYRINETEVLIACEPEPGRAGAIPLSVKSEVVGRIAGSNQRLLYVPKGCQERARELLGSGIGEV